MLACLLLGFAEAAAIQMQGVIPHVRVEYIQIIPYVLTIVVLAGFIGRLARLAHWGGRTLRNKRTSAIIDASGTKCVSLSAA